MIQRFSLDVNQMTCGREGEYVRLADHLENMRVLREALKIARGSVCWKLDHTQTRAGRIRAGLDLRRIDAALKETDDGN